MTDIHYVRINKFLSEAGFCSRRGADILIEEGRVTVNGKVPEMGTKIAPTDIVCVDGVQIIAKTDKHIYIALNKPVGIVSTTDIKAEKDNIIDFVNHPQRIFPIGRLDKASEGLIFLTSDGDMVNKVLRAGNYHEKEYIVTVHKPIRDEFIRKMANGVPILDVITRKCHVEALDNYRFKIILTQGINRQIRRMCSYFDYQVTRLERVRIMNIKLDLPIGKWRELSSTEMTQINKMVALSSKTAPETRD